MTSRHWTASSTSQSDVHSRSLTQSDSVVLQFGRRWLSLLFGEGASPDRFSVSHLSGWSEPDPSIQPAGDLVRWVNGQDYRRRSELAATVKRGNDDLGSDPSTLVASVDGEIDDLGSLATVRQRQNGDDCASRLDERERLPAALVRLHVRLRKNNEGDRLVIRNHRKLFSGHPDLNRSAPVRAIDDHERPAGLRFHLPCLGQASVRELVRPKTARYQHRNRPPLTARERRGLPTYPHDCARSGARDRPLGVS